MMLSRLFNPCIQWHYADMIDPLDELCFGGLWLNTPAPRTDAATPDGNLFEETRFARELQELRATVAELQTDNERLLDANAKMMKALTKRNGKVEELEARLQKLSDPIYDTANLRLTQENEKLRREITAAVQAYDQQKELLDEKRKRITQLEKGIDGKKERDHLRETTRQGRGQVETKVILQELRSPRDIQLYSEELDTLLNTGWKILDLQSNSVWNGHTHEIEHHRIVTLKRQKPTDAPQPEQVIVRETFPFNEQPPVMTGQIVEDMPAPEGDPVLNRIESVNFTFAQARQAHNERGLFTVEELKQIGDYEAMKPLRDLMEQWKVRPYPPPPSRPAFRKVEQP